jgi:hypothetical protein
VFRLCTSRMSSSISSTLDKTSSVIRLDPYWTGWHSDGLQVDWISVAIAVGWIG